MSKADKARFTAKGIRRADVTDAAAFVLAATLRLGGASEGEDLRADLCPEAVECLARIQPPSSEADLVARERAEASLRRASTVVESTPQAAIAQRLVENGSLIVKQGEAGFATLVYEACAAIAPGADATDLRAILTIALGLDERMEDVLTEGAASGEDDFNPVGIFMSGTAEEAMLAIPRLPASSGIETPLKTGAMSPAQTPLMLAAAANSDPGVIEALCEAGADVNARDGNGRTSLMNAASMNRNPEVTRALIAAGADIRAVNTFGFTALIVAAISNPTVEVHEALIAAGSDVDAVSTDADGATALLFACENSSSAEVVQLLLASGADPWRKTRGGRTALELVRANGALAGTAAESALLEIGLT